MPAATVPVTTPPVGPAPTAIVVESTSYLAAVSTIANQTTGTLLENFDLSGTTGGPLPGWIYESGSEFPGANGQLTLAAGKTTPSLAANLQADLNCGATTIQLQVGSSCGLYVAMTRRLGSLYSTSSPDKAMIALNVQTTHPLLATSLRVIDGTGQTLQYPYSPRSLETNAGATWARVKVPIGLSSSYWGGANDGRLYNGITTFSLTAGKSGLVGPSSTLKLDDARLVDSGASVLALSRQASVLKTGVLPSVAGRFTVSSHFNQLSDTELSQAASIGISTVRLDIFWRTAEVGGRFDFSSYDTILKQLSKHGMSALFILAYGHPDHGGGGAPLTNADRAAYVEFARQAALFSKGRNVVALEIWNEPDNGNFWTHGDPDTYAQLLTPARLAIKAADPSRKVINGGPSWVNLPYILRLAKSGALNPLDGFAIHPYRSTAPETFAADISPIKSILSSQGMAAPSIWVTEWGYSSFGSFDRAVYGDGHDPRALARQGVLILRTVLTETALNLPLMTIYELSDAGFNPELREENFGLLTKNGVAKPSFTALKTLYSFTKTRNYIGLVEDVPANVHAMRWDGSDDSVFATWTDSPNVPVTLTVPRAATVTSWSGTSLPTTPTANPATSELKLTEAGGPVFVRFPITTTQ